MATDKVTSATFNATIASGGGISISGSYAASGDSNANAITFWAYNSATNTYYNLGTLTGETGGTHSFTYLSTKSIPTGTYTVLAYAVKSTALSPPSGSTQIGSQSGDSLCFMAGTMIRTPDGEAAVETLQPGDLVLTTAGVAKPVNWLGRQSVCMTFADPLRSGPIRVKAGALGENIPSRDLLVSPDHALLVDGVLAHASALVNGTSIVREADVPNTFVYYHVELDDHSLILAENTPAETFIDNVDRLKFDNWAEFEALYPQGKTVEELPYPRAKSQRQVPVNIRVRLAERALAIGAAAVAVA